MSAIDNKTERLFAAAIDSLTWRKTIFIITHRRFTVRNCDTVYFTQSTDIIGIGDHEELLATRQASAQLVRGHEP